MSEFSQSTLCPSHTVAIARCDRWQIYHRLQDLMIPCACLKDGSLQVEVHHPMAALLVRSTVQQFVASRQELVSWLERCWQCDLN